MSNIAVLLTCHNRREKTLACLDALFANHLPKDVSLHVILVDDGSTDGTSAAVNSRFPYVNILVGDGGLYWSGGMRLAFAEAMKKGYEYYLWLNDDTELDPDALKILLDVSNKSDSEQLGRKGNIIVGATRDPIDGQLTYGGLVSRGRWSPYHYINLPYSEQIQECLTLNGNCALIPREVADSIGNIDSAFVHAIGDWDYGLRARRASFGVLMAPGFVGKCKRNPPKILSPEVGRSVVARVKEACGSKQVPPYAWFVYVRRHCGLLWPVYFLRPYVGAVLRAFAQRRWRSM